MIIIFINDLDDGVVNKILKFADDTKIVSKFASEYQIKILQSDLHKMFNVQLVAGLANAVQHG